MSGPEANRGVASNWNCPLSVPTFDALPLQAPTGIIVMTEDDGASYQFDSTAWNEFPTPAPPAEPQESFVLGLDEDMVFANAGGNTNVTPQTFIRNDDPITADRVWNFATIGGIGEGWAAWLDVTLDPGGTLELQSGGDTLTTFDGAAESRAQALLYVDSDGWQLYGDSAADSAIVSMQDKGIAVSVAPTVLRTAPPMATYAVYVELAGVDSENDVTLELTWTDSAGPKSQLVAMSANSYASGVFVIQPSGVGNVSFQITVVTADLGYDYYIGIIPIDVSTP
jgi:hypothetical protein